MGQARFGNATPDMKKFFYTSHQVARGARPDAHALNTMYLIKSVTRLRATYQIRLLAFRAVERGEKLVLRVPAACRFDPALETLLQACNGAVRRENY